MHGAYRQLEHAKLVSCWAHVRRKFFEAIPKQADKNSLGRKGLGYCDKMFVLEAEWRELSPQETLEPLMDTFFDWCRDQVVLPGSKLGLAIACSLKYERTFRTVLEDGHLTLSTNMALSAILVESY